jgi:hypothetical protein
LDKEEVSWIKKKDCKNFHFFSKLWRILELGRRCVARDVEGDSRLGEYWHSKNIGRERVTSCGGGRERVALSNVLCPK